MAVYVDELVWEWRGRTWCHLLADTEEELHHFAGRVGLARFKCQRRPGRPWRDHYDLDDRARLEAVRLGAIEITFHEAGLHVAARRRRLLGR